MEPANAEIYQHLSRMGARSKRAADLGTGLSLVSWNNSNGHAIYDSPTHHTLSFYLQGGKGTRRVLSQDKTTDHGFPGAICLMPAHIPSEWMIEDSFFFMHLYFEDSFFCKLIEETLDKDSRNFELLDLTYGDDPVIANIFRNLIEPQDWENSTDRMSLSTAGHLMVQHLIKYYTNQSDTKTPRLKGGLSSHVEKRIKDYIQARLHTGLTIDELAEEAQLSAFHFARMFQTSTGISPHQFVLLQRINRAKALLSHSKESLADVALQCGFSSQSHLNNRFQKQTGLTPGQFRKLS